MSVPARARDLPDTLHVGVGQVAHVRLPGIGGGYVWRVAAASADGVRVHVEPAAAPASPPDGATPASATAGATLVVQGRQAGTVQVQLELSRSWQPPLLVHRLAVTVG